MTYLQTVPARTGIQWLTSSLRLTLRHPFALLGLLMLGMLLLALISSLPLIGQMLALALFPSFSMGMLACYHAASHKLPLGVPTLLAALRGGPQSTQGMLALGAIYAMATFTILLLCAAVDPDLFYALMLQQQPMPAADIARQAAQPGSHFMLAMILFLVLSMLLGVVMTLAAPLILWQQQPVIKALFFSLLCCMRNAKAILLALFFWGAGLFVLSMVMGLITSLLSMLGLGGLAMLLLMPMLLVMLGTFYGLPYFAFNDCFVTDHSPRHH